MPDDPIADGMQTRAGTGEGPARTADPNFLLIGAQKCGTTWLARMIAAHPDVYAPPRKELHFFDERYHEGIESYRRQFAGWRGQRAVGEFTPNYFWVAGPGASGREGRGGADIPERVRRHFPAMRLIVMLRDPVTRAISAFFHHVRKRRISPFAGILRVRDLYGIFEMGIYHRHLSRWLEVFPRDRFLILIYEEDVLEGKAETLSRVYRFLGVDPAFRPSAIEGRHNSRPGELSLFLTYYAPRLTRALERRIPAFVRFGFPLVRVRPEERRRLAELYEPHNRRLERLLGRRLERWSLPSRGRGCRRPIHGWTEMR